MKSALPEMVYIYNKLLSDEQKNIIEDFLKNVQVNKEKSEVDICDIRIHFSIRCGGMLFFCKDNRTSSTG